MDLAVIENSGNGGDIVFKNNDLVIVNGFENMPYLAMFGGTQWWANDLIFFNDESKQFKQLTQKVLETVALNSSGRISIQNAVVSDLKFMQDFATVNVEVSIISDDKVLINIQLIRKDNLQKTELIYIWDNTLSTVTKNN